VARSLRSQVCLFSVTHLLRTLDQFSSKAIAYSPPLAKNFEFCNGIKAMEAIWL